MRPLIYSNLLLISRHDSLSTCKISTGARMLLQETSYIWPISGRGYAVGAECFSDLEYYG